MHIGIGTADGDMDVSLEGEDVDDVGVCVGIELVNEGTTVGLFEGDNDFSLEGAVVGDIEVVTEGEVVGGLEDETLGETVTLFVVLLVILYTRVWP